MTTIVHRSTHETRPDDLVKLGSEAALTPRELQRYARHLIIPEIGLRGQRALKAARVLLVGTGGLGSPAALYLAAAGVGTLGLVDFDIGDPTNLHRQILHGTRDIAPKLDSACDRLGDVNPHVELIAHATRLTRENALDILSDFDLVVDGTDNFATRYLVNDTCVLLGKPNVYGSIFRFEGQVAVFDASRGPCYRCLFREPPPPGLVPSCAEGGVLGVLPGIIGSLQALEAVKLITGVGMPLIGRMQLFDALSFGWQELRIRIKSSIDRGQSIVIIDVREPHEWDVANLEAIGARLIPLGSLANGLKSLDAAADIVVYCRSGMRGGKAAHLLREQGFPHVRNLSGGILAWANEIDPAMPRY